MSTTDSNARLLLLEQGARDAGSAEKAILAGLEDPAESVRERAIALAARHLAPEALGRLVGNDENAVLRNSALGALERQGPFAVPHLMTLTRAPNAELAMFAVQVLSRIRDPSTVDALLPLLEHPDSNIAQAAVEALGNVRAQKAVPGLIRLLDKDLWLQFAAVAALGEIADERAVFPLLDTIPNEMVAEPAVEALGQIASPDSLPRLLNLLADHERLPLRDQVLRAVAQVAERHPTPPSVFTRFRRRLAEEQLERGLADYLAGLLASDETELARAAASLALSAQLAQLYPLVVLRAASPDPEEVRWTAMLCRRHEKSLRASLASLLQNGDPRVRQGALLTIPLESGALAIKLLDDQDASVRAAACQALGRCHETQAIPALVERFRAGSAQEIAAAAEALGAMPGSSLLLLAPFLEPKSDRVLATLAILEAAKSSLFEDKIIDLLEAPTAPLRRAALRVLVNLSLGEVDFEDYLVRKLSDPDDSVRVEAVELIVRNGSTRAVPALIGLLARTDDLRYHAIRALGRLRAQAAASGLEALFAQAGGNERLEIVAALIRIAAPNALPFLKARLADESAPEVELRRVAADGLARVATAVELPLLVKLAEDPDWNLRNHAGWGLGRLGLAEGREALLALVRDLEPVVARTARAALLKLHG